MQFIIEQLLPGEDCNFLNSCKIPFDLLYRSELVYGRILTKNDQIRFTTDCEKDALVLKLKFGERLKEIFPAS